MDTQVHADICPSCGIVYAKWRARQQGEQTTDDIPLDSPTTSITTNYDEPREKFREFITYVPEKIDPGIFWGRVAIFAGFVAWSFYFISAGVD